WSDGNWLGDLLAVAVVRSNEDGVTLDRDHELGEVSVADDPSELLLGLEHAGGGPALAHVTVLPAFHVALGVADDLDVGSEASRHAALARGGLLAPALRTGRARSHASGAPQGWPLVDQGVA